MKKLYAVLWVDDFGSFPLNNKDVEWYHRVAGPLSFAIESDDRVCVPLRRHLRNMSAVDYASHHLHATRWRGARLPKRLHDALHVTMIVRSILKTVGSKTGKKMFRLFWVSGMVFVLGAAFLAIFINLYLFAAVALVLLGLLLILGLWVYVQDRRNWEYYLCDPQAWQDVLLRSRQEFETNIGAFPAVVRHGWNLPPEGSMEFYLSKMSVLADASSTPTAFDGNPHISDRSLAWKTATPYYASIKGDYNTPWAGQEEDRGLLELPAVLGNIAYFGFGQNEKDVLEQLPEGGLASAYMHPWDDFRNVRACVRFLKDNYEVTFLRADEYASMYMKKAPRPVVLGRDVKPRWAFLRAGVLVPIREVANGTIGARIVGRKVASMEIELTVSTEAPLPLLAIEGERIISTSAEALRFEKDGAQLIAKRVRAGVYIVDVAF